MKKLSKIASVLAITFVGVCLVACQQPTTENSNGLATLPGTAGGSANAKDIFKGKTFYNNAEESKAYRKYVFGTDGTYTYYSNSNLDYDENGVVRNEFKYSLSSDGNTMYQMLNRTRASSTDSELKTYQELLELLNDESFKEFMEESKKAWDSESDDKKKELLSAYGLENTATFEQFYQAALKSLFSVREYKITNEGKSCIKLTPASVDGSEYPIFLYSTNTN